MPTLHRSLLLFPALVLCAFLLVTGDNRAQAQPDYLASDTVVVREGLAVGGMMDYDRSVVYTDILLHRWATGALAAPSPEAPWGWRAGPRGSA